MEVVHIVCRIIRIILFQIKTALRLVALCQTLSCAPVEGVFSRLKMMRDACGDKMHEDMAETIRRLCNAMGI